jgi:membrane-associated phospholipid phosphatase
VLARAAWVLGYERPDVERRFESTARAYRWLPLDSNSSPAGMARIRCYLFLLLPWVFLYEVIVWSGQPKDAFTLPLPGEASWPILAWTEPVYMSTYFVVGLAPLLAPTSRSLRQFMIRAWLAMGIAFLLYLAVPLIGPLKPFHQSGFWADALRFERRADPPLAAFPSFHTIWAFLTAELLVACRRKYSWLWRVWALGIAFSCVATGMHWTADVIAGLLLSLVLIRGEAMWSALRGMTEAVANSWREWRIGPVRIMNHGFYGGVAIAAALSLVAILTGPGDEAAFIVSACTGLAGSWLWARAFPNFGNYGAFAGVVIGCGLAQLFGADAAILLGAYCVAAPCMQFLGRLRCLVQGCCHGRPAGDDTGIRYHHPQSRVARLEHLHGRPLYPTQLYSMFWNLLNAVVLARMWMTGCDVYLIAGAFAMLTGFGRFVEEAYRGEPQAQIIGNLRVDQWISAVLVMSGAMITALAHGSGAPKPAWNTTGLVIAIAAGLVSTLVFGLEFQPSNRRLARAA